jgi:hypothetical protein
MVASIALLASLILQTPAAVNAAPAPAVVQEGLLADASGQPMFVLGVNYEGPVDRPWRMWDNGQFDLGLIGKDLDRAKAANATTVRVFVQQGLANDIRAGNWDKLDHFLDLADQRGLRVILTMADYGSASVSGLAAIAGQIAAHTKGRGTILALDLKNEPHFGDLALATYPPGVTPTLQDPGVVGAVGESIARQDIPDYRNTDDGRQRVPARLTDDQAYVYINVLRAYLGFIAEAQRWANSHHSSVVQYAQSPDSGKWGALKNALNDTLGAWLKPQLDAIRGADPTRLVTLAQVDPFLATLPVNDWLDYRTFHRYPAKASTDGIASAIALFDAVKATDPGKPLLLGEFGISNDATNEQDTATLEAAMVRAVHDHGGAGALKWMLNDVPNGGNAVQDAYGMFHGDGSPKPVVAAFKALGTLAPQATAPQATAPQAAAPPPAAAVNDQRFFAQTGFRIDSDPIWSYFQARGQIDIFGYPISRTFTFLGCQAQMFQRQIVQICADGQPRLMNILDPDLFPYTHVNGSTFPSPDPAVKGATPPTSDPAYATKIVDFVHSTAPDAAFGQPVDFAQKFFNTIGASSGATAPGIVSLLDLEVWGAPISKPVPDPKNAGFIYQRFQRGIMHYIAAQQSTQSILAVDYLKQVLTNAQGLPDDLRQEAKGSRLFGQYCPQKPNWLCRPNDLPGTDLTSAFESNA